MASVPYQGMYHYHVRYDGGQQDDMVPCRGLGPELMNQDHEVVRIKTVSRIRKCFGAVFV